MGFYQLPNPTGDRPFNIPHGLLYDGGAFTPIDVPGALFALVFGINPRGQIVGRYFYTTGVLPTFSSREHGFLYDRGVFTTIDVPFPGVLRTPVTVIVFQRADGRSQSPVDQRKACDDL